MLVRKNRTEDNCPKKTLPKTIQHIIRALKLKFGNNTIYNYCMTHHRNHFCIFLKIIKPNAFILRLYDLLDKNINFVPESKKYVPKVKII